MLKREITKLHCSSEEQELKNEMSSQLTTFLKAEIERLKIEKEDFHFTVKHTETVHREQNSSIHAELSAIILSRGVEQLSPSLKNVIKQVLGESGTEIIKK